MYVLSKQGKMSSRTLPLAVREGYFTDYKEFECECPSSKHSIFCIFEKQRRNLQERKHLRKYYKPHKKFFFWQVYWVENEGWITKFEL